VVIDIDNWFLRAASLLGRRRRLCLLPPLIWFYYSVPPSVGMPFFEPDYNILMGIRPHKRDALKYWSRVLIFIFPILSFTLSLLIINYLSPNALAAAFFYALFATALEFTRSVPLGYVIAAFINGVVSWLDGLIGNIASIRRLSFLLSQEKNRLIYDQLSHQLAHEKAISILLSLIVTNLMFIAFHALRKSDLQRKRKRSQSCAYP
jgi:positive regulator of sigma E activity